MDLDLDLAKRFNVSIEHNGVVYPQFVIFHDATTHAKVVPGELQKAGQRMGVQMMDAIDNWARTGDPLVKPNT